MTDAATPATPPKTDSRLRQLVDFGGLLAFGAAFLVMRLRGLSGDEAIMAAFEENSRDLARVGGN